MKKKITPLLFLAALSTLISMAAFQKQHWDTDIFWALKSGEWIVENLRVPDTDLFSYTFGGQPWIDFTWGFQAVSRLVFFAGGWAGLSVLQFAVVSLTFIIIWLNLRLLTRHGWAAALILMLVFADAYPRFFIRPHIFEYLFISLNLLLLTLYGKNGRQAFLWALLPLQAVWVNIHSSAILGVFITGAYALGGVIDALRLRGFNLKSIDDGLRRLIYASVLLPFASLINPYGVRLSVFPFIHQGGENIDALRHISEWMRPPISELFFFVFPFPLYHFAFEVLVFGAFAFLVLNMRNLKARDVIILAGAVYMAKSHIRWVHQFGFFAAPLLARNIDEYIEYAREGRVALIRWSSVLLTVFFAAFASYDLFLQFREYGGTGVERGFYPEGTIAFMRGEGIRGNMYNEYDYGGYIIFSYPEAKVFIDGRTPTVYSPFFYWKSRIAVEPAHWRRLVAEYSISSALVKASDPFCGKLVEDKEWAPVSFDDVSVLFLKRPEYAGVINEWGLAGLNPCSVEAKLKLPDDEAALEGIRARLKKALSRPEAALSARPHRVLGLVDTKIGKKERIEEAADELGRALAIKADAYAYYDYGVALGKLKRYGEAIEAFERAVGKNSGFKDPYLGLGLARYDLKEYGKAIPYLERYIMIADDRADFLSYKALGMSYFEVSSFDRAVINLKRASFIAEDNKELGEVFYFLGNSLFERGEYEEGAVYYRKALKTDPAYRGVLLSLSDSFKKMGRADEAGYILSIPELKN